MNWSSFQQNKKGHALSSASAPAPKNKSEYSIHKFRAKPLILRVVCTRGSNPSACAKCGTNHLGMCMMGTVVASSVSITVISCKNVQRTSKVMLVGAIESSLLQLLYQTKLHLEELLQVVAEDQTAYILS